MDGKGITSEVTSGKKRYRAEKGDVEDIAMTTRIRTYVAAFIASIMISIK